MASDNRYIDILILLLSLDTYTSTQKALTNVRAFLLIEAAVKVVEQQ